MIAEFVTPTDARWPGVLKRVQHDVYHLPEYVSFAAVSEGGTPCAFLAEAEEAFLFVPLLVHSLPSIFNSEGYDAANPYGYPTPLFWGNPERFQELIEQFTESARQAGIISVFLRLHPLIEVPLEILAHHGEVVQHGATVVVDLTKDLPELEADIRKGYRYDVRRLQKAGFQVVWDNWQMLEAFAMLYHDTMRRIGTSEKYLFSVDYFENLRGYLDDRLQLCCVMSRDGDLAGGALITRCNGIAQYHLSAVADEFISLSPSKLVLSDAIRRLKQDGIRLFHLGGGVGASSDSLFHFKTGFAKSRTNFATCRIITNREEYDRLAIVAGPSSQHSEQFFPTYRRHDEYLGAGNSS